MDSEQLLRYGCNTCAFLLEEGEGPCDLCEAGLHCGSKYKADPIGATGSSTPVFGGSGANGPIERTQNIYSKGIGDINSDAKGSGARYNDGKPDFSLIPLSTLEDEARVWMYGAKKYKSWNWAKGMDWSIPYACAMRHLAAWQRGEEVDEESGLPHLAHAMCNLRMLTLYSKTYKEGDNRPPKELMP